CGISQIAIGADTLFTEACARANVPQRIFLPQSRAEYLNAKGAEGTPDFDDVQRETAARLLRSEHIIQERVVGLSEDRTERFEETNLEILRVSDLVVCLAGTRNSNRRGGTN